MAVRGGRKEREGGKKEKKKKEKEKERERERKKKRERKRERESARIGETRGGDRRAGRARAPVGRHAVRCAERGRIGRRYGNWYWCRDGGSPGRFREIRGLEKI